MTISWPAVRLYVAAIPTDEAVWPIAFSTSPERLRDLLDSPDGQALRLYLAEPEDRGADPDRFITEIALDQLSGFIDAGTLDAAREAYRCVQEPPA